MIARCPSSLEVARWEAARADGGEDLHGLGEHFHSCLHCAGVLEDIAAARADVLPGDAEVAASYAARRIAAVVADRHASERRRQWRLFGWVGVRAAAAAVLLAVIGTRIVGGPGPMVAPVVVLESGEHAAGHLLVEAYCKRGDSTFRVEDGAAFLTGDHLRFAYTAPRAGYLMIFGVDDGGQLFPYYGEGALAGLPVTAGAAVMLPGSVELDDHHGYERVYALWSPAPIDAALVRQAVTQAQASGLLGEAPRARLAVPADQVSYLLRRP